MMKRDLDLIRSIMLKIESSSNSRIFLDDFLDLNSDMRTLSFHVELLNDAHFIEVFDEYYEGDVKLFDITRLTMSGCDYLDSVRDVSVWQKTKAKIATVAESSSLDVIKSVAVSILKSQLGV